MPWAAGDDLSATNLNTKRPSWSSIYPFYDVKEFGAVGDGVTDDAPSIRTALSRGSCVVWFPAGTYLCNSTVTVSNNGITLSMAPNASLKMGASGPDLLQITGSNVAVRGGKVDANNLATNPIRINPGSTGGAIAGTDYAIDGVEVTGGPDGGTGAITVTRADRVWIRDCYIHGNKTYGIFLTQNLRGTRVTGCIIDQSDATSSDRDGIQIAGSTSGTSIRDIHLIDNVIRNISGSASYGIETVATSGDLVRDVVIRGNTISAATDTAGGISVGGGCRNVTVDANTFDADGYTHTTGVEVAGGSTKTTFNVVVSNNAFRCGPGTGNGARGVYVVNAVEGVVVSGNVIEGFKGLANVGGIDVVASSSGCTATDVVISGNRMVFSAGTGDTAIRLQTANAAAGMEGVSIVGNLIRGTNVAGTRGIKIREDSGVMTGVFVGGNYISQVAAAIDVDSTTASLSVGLNSAVSCSAVFSGSHGTGTLVEDRNGVTHALLLGYNWADGSTIYVTDGTVASPTTSGGSGTLAIRRNGAWDSV